MTADRDQVVGLVLIILALVVPTLVIARAILRDLTGTDTTGADTTRDPSRLDHLDGVCGCEDGDCAWCAAREWER